MMMDPYLMMHQEKHHRKSKESKEAPKLYFLRKPVWFIGVRCFFHVWQGKEKGKEKGKKAKQHPFGNSFPYLFGLFQFSTLGILL